MSTELAPYTPEPNDPPALQALPAAIAQIESLLPSDQVDRFVRGVALYVRSTPSLHIADPASVLQSVLTAARIGLELGTEAFIVAYGKDKTASLVPGYKGYRALAMRTHGILVHADLVYEADEYDDDMGVILHHRKSPTESKLLWAYAVATLPDGRRIGKMLPAFMLEKKRRRALDSIEDRNKRASSPWQTHPEAMYVKSAVRALFNDGSVPVHDSRMRELVDLDRHIETTVETPKPRSVLPFRPTPYMLTEAPADEATNIPAPAELPEGF
jgi:phage RecT family recombinase